jgi:hypothetical protein
MTAIRIAKTCGDEERLRTLVHRLLEVARAGLPSMYRGEEGSFGFSCRRGPRGGTRVQGVSPRYGAIVLLGARLLDESSQERIFGGIPAADFCGRLLSRLEGSRNLGDLALATWAAAELSHRDLGVAIDFLRVQLDRSPNPSTVEAAWTLSALAAAHGPFDLRAEARRVRDRMLAALPAGGALFPHWLDIAGAPRHRRHLACFADQVYPIQALARNHRVFQDPESLEIANRCAARICRLQGEAGQWWWHYDVRTGEVLEGYPVYSVHQDAMAPMALLDLLDAGGADHSEAIRRGLRWMESAPEIGRTLIEDDLALIWRKVCRAEPGKLVRALRATASLVHPRLRLEWLDAIFPPRSVDHESRPYHLGWILFAWLDLK